MKLMKKIILASIITINCLVIIGCGKKLVDTENQEVGSTNQDTQSKPHNNEDINENGTIEANLKNSQPTIYSDNDIEIYLYGCKYTENESDVQITIGIDNYSGKSIIVTLDNINISDAQFREKFSGHKHTPIQPDSGVASNFYVDKDEIIKSGVSNFVQFNCKVNAKYESSGEELFSKDISISRDIFE